jgi:hypothetical protein
LIASLAVETGIAPDVLADTEPSLLATMIEYIGWRNAEVEKANRGR